LKDINLAQPFFRRGVFVKKCSQCGEENDFDDKVCQECGAPLDKPGKSPAKDDPLILETPNSPKPDKKKPQDTTSSWNQSHWEKEPDYEQAINKTTPIENVELDLSDEKEEDQTTTRIERSDLELEGESYQEEEIAVQNPIEANVDMPPYQPLGPSEENSAPRPEKEYSQAEAPETDDPNEKEKKKAELEAMLRKEMEPAHKSKGIAHFDNNCIRFAGGVDLTAGQEIKIGDQDYILKPIERKKIPYLYIGMAALVILVATISLIARSNKLKDYGHIVGYVYNQKSEARLPDALIEVKDLGKRVKSDNLGIFEFDLIPPGSYDLQVNLAGFNTKQSFAMVEKKKGARLSIGLKPEQAPKIAMIEQRTPEPATESVKPSPSQEQFGKIKVKVDVPEAIVLVDNKMLGKGSATYSEISTGPHTLRITASGYQDWVKNIRVLSGKMLELEANLSEVKYVEQISATDFIHAGEEAFNQGNYDKALENYIKAVRANSKDGKAYLGRGLTYKKLEQNKAAKEDLTTAAKLFVDSKDYAQTTKCYDVLLEINPDDPDLYYYRGLCYSKTEQYDKSIQDLQKATDLRPKFFWAYLELSYAYYKAGQHEKSAESAEKAKKVNPHDKRVYVRLAESYLAMGDKTRTKENYSKFAELTTLADREDMKEDPEWKKVLQALNISDSAEF
jgi:tetratricopeptide (TPR) repeat protein